MGVLLFLVVVGVGLTNVLWVSSMRPILRERIVDSQETLAANAAFRIEEIVRAKVRNLILRSQTTAFLEKNLLAVEQELAIILRQDGDLQTVSFLDEEGQELAKLALANVFASEDLKSRSESPEFLVPMFRYGLEYIGPVYFGSDGEPFITISVPVVVPIARQNVEDISTQEPGLWQRNIGEIKGVLTAEASLKDVLRSNSDIFEIGKGGTMYLVDVSDRLIDHTDAQFFENHEGVVQSHVLREHRLADEKLLRETGGHPFEQILTVEGLSEKGEGVLATFYHMPRFKWGLIVEEPLTQVFAPLNRVGNFAFLLFLGGIGVTTVVSFWFSQLLTRPISILHKGAEMIGQRNFAHRVYLRTNDEIQELAEALNTMAQSLQEAMAREKEISRMKSEFLSIAAHQLRTPLSALKWVLHMTLDGDMGKLTKKQKDLLQKGYDSNERMITLVNDLLDVVRIEEGRFDYKFKKVEFVGFVGGVLEEMKIIATQKQIYLTFHKPSGAMPEITVDAGKLRLALINIIDNALQYTRAHGKVDVRVAYEDNILVTVQDTGIGISSNQIPRVFSKFFRADNAVRMQTSGSGLGLFIAKNIIERHGGKIWIESEEGKGTTVRFTLPFSRLKN